MYLSVMKVRLGESGYEYEFPGETHSGKDIRLVNSDCLDVTDSSNRSCDKKITE